MNQNHHIIQRTNKVIKPQKQTVRLLKEFCMQYIKPKSIRDYEIVKELGKGAYGVAYLARKKGESKPLVLKAIRIKEMKSRNQRASFRQVSILKSLDHPNIIKYEGSFCDDENLYIIMEYAQRGDLYNLIKTKRERRSDFSQQEIWKMAGDLISALNYLHGKLIIHRDLKTLNIFIAQNGALKLGDLGVSKILNEDSLQHTRIGTPLYLAPELIKHENYDFKADVWGLGIILYLVTTLEHPFMGKNIISLGQSIVRDTPRQVPSKYSANLKKLISQLLEKDPKKRPTCSYVLKSYPELLDRKPKANNNFLDCKLFQQIKDKTQSTKQQEIATNRLRREMVCSPPRPLLHDFQPTYQNEFPKTKKVDSFIETYKAIPSERKKRVIHNLDELCQTPQAVNLASSVKVLVPEATQRGFSVKQIPSSKLHSQTPLSVPKPVKQLDHPIPIDLVSHFSSVTPSNKDVKRPMSAAVYRVAEAKKGCCSITLRDLLKVKNSTEMQKQRIVSQEAQPIEAPIKVEWIEEPAPINRIRPMSGTTVGRYYKVKPLTEKSTVLSRSFTKPKCPTVELVKPPMLIMDFCRKIDN